MALNNVTGTLTIMSAEIDAEGDYSCRVYTELQPEAISPSAFLNVISEFLWIKWQACIIYFLIFLN